MSGNHAVTVLLRHSVRDAAEASVVRNNDSSLSSEIPAAAMGHRDRFRAWGAGHLVFLAAFFVQTYPSAPSLAEVIPYIHLQDRTHPGEGIYHHRDQLTVTRPVTEPRVPVADIGREEVPNARLLAPP